MGQWFKRKPKSKTDLILEANAASLIEKNTRNAYELYNHQKDAAFVILEESFKNSFLIQLAETNIKAALGQEKELYSYQRGRLDAITDVLSFLETCKSKTNHDLLKKQLKPSESTKGRVLGFKEREEK